VNCDEMDENKPRLPETFQHLLCGVDVGDIVLVVVVAVLTCDSSP